MFTLGIDVGGTSIRIGAVDENFEISFFEKHSVKTILLGKPEDSLGDFISAYIESHSLDKKISAICVGFPATVDKKRETVLSAPNLPGFDGVNFKRALEAKLAVPAFIEKDVNLLIRGDLHRMNISAKDIVGCYIGTGLGNAIVIDGKTVTGHSGVAGELGHIPFGDTESECGCGNCGCAEPLVGGKYLTRLCEKVFKDTEIPDIFTLHSESNEIKRYLDRLARVIASEVNILDPELLILGGGIPEMKDFPKDVFTSLVMKYVRKPLPANDLNIVFSKGTSDVGVLGAGIYAHKQTKASDL